MSDNHTGLSHDMPEYVSNVPVAYTPELRVPRTVLCVGGPGDGQWRTVDRRIFEMAEMPKLDFSALDTTSVIEPLKRYQYRVDAFSMFGFSAWVAVCEREFMGSSERSKAILRALLQRDVAAQMGVL